MTEINIRECKMDDLNKIIDIEETCFDNPYPDDVFFDYMDSELFLVAEKRDIVGYIIADERGDKALIISIAVLPEYRREGIGSKLIEKVLEKIKNDFVILTLRINNEEAYKFYQSLGFTYSGIIEDYYENSEDGVLMKKTL